MDVGHRIAEVLRLVAHKLDSSQEKSVDESRVISGDIHQIKEMCIGISASVAELSQAVTGLNDTVQRHLDSHYHDASRPLRSVHGGAE